MLIKTQNTDLGYLLLDNRASGFKPEGTNTDFFEAATYTCSHCQAVVVMNPERKRERYTCRGCSHMICDPCAAKRASGEGCKTYAQKLDEILQAEVKQTSSGLILP